MAKQSDMEKIAHVLRVNPQTVRKGLEQGVYPFGCAVKCNKAYSYQFFPVKVKEYLGIEVGVEIGEDEKED